MSSATIEYIGAGLAILLWVAVIVTIRRWVKTHPNDPD